jgi:hypothetical protein
VNGKNPANSHDLATLVRILAENGVKSAEEIEIWNAEDASRLQAAALRLGISPDNAAFDLLRSPEISLQRMRIETRILTVARKSVEADVGLSVGGRLVHSFFRRRFFVEQEHFENLTVELERVEPSPTGIEKKGEI